MSITVKICDMVMGAGKTESAITRMKEDTESKYIFITPYLDEVDRIKEGCCDRNFKEPENKGDGKLDNLHFLLGNGHNISSTHALFKQYSDYTLELIINGNYKLILDEVFSVVELVEISRKDLDLLINNKTILIDKISSQVIWNDIDYEGEFSPLRKMSENGDLVLFKDKLIFWTFPIKIFSAFKDVTILTYMFDAQIQKYYYDYHNVDIEYIGTKRVNGVYQFTNTVIQPEYVKSLKNKIHILHDDKLNLIGEYQYALSSSWFDREKKNKSKKLLTNQLKNNLTNLYKYKFKVPLEKRLWTTFKEYKSLIHGAGYTSAFASCNLRATNEYRDRTHLAYCINVYLNPIYKAFFYERHVDVLEDKYALSEMIQWIWRSAIREGKEIWVYIPSSRMRHLLEDWLDELQLV